MYNEHCGREYSEQPAAVYNRARRALDPARYAAERAEHNRRRKERRLLDPVYRASCLEVTRNRLKAARRDPERWPRSVLRHIRSKCKREGIPYNLTPADVRPPTHCPVLGMPLTFGQLGGAAAASVDRLRPDLGYVRGNVRVISRLANAVKSNATTAQVTAVAAWMARENLP